MASIPLIGLTGPARSGKDTVASFIIAHQGGYQYSFADPIRDMLRALNIDMRSEYWKAHKEDIIPALGVSPRHMMQTLGTEWGRECVNQNLWLIMAKEMLLTTGAGMVVSDVRFENEAEWIRSLGGLVIHIQRKGAPKVKAHASETGIKRLDQDKILYNSGSLEDLQHSVRELLDVTKT